MRYCLATVAHAPTPTSAHNAVRNKCVFIAAVAVAALLLKLAASSCWLLLLAAAAGSFLLLLLLPPLFLFLFSFSFSWSARREREREVPSQMGPSDLHKASALLHSHRHSVASLINRARAFHAHAYRLLRAQRTSAHRGDTEAPRMPCCANNTTAHVRDISFYYYPSVRSLALSTSPLPRILQLLLPPPLLSCSLLAPFPRFQPFFLLPPALLLFLLSSGFSFCSCITVCISPPLLFLFL